MVPVPSVQPAVGWSPSREILLRLLAPSTPSWDSETCTGFASTTDWGGICAVLNRCGLGALAYQRWVNNGAAIPKHVAMWLRAQHDHTLQRNLFLFQDLDAVTTNLLRQGIPVLALKGLILGHIGTGAFVRPSNDLDVLVQRDNFLHAAEILRTLGFVEIRRTPHRFHQVFVRMYPAQRPATVLELHFDLADHGRPYTPDTVGVWTRSADIEVHGHVVRCPELTDHLLLTIMQLPHHHFNPRLLFDIAYIVHDHCSAINWKQFIQRAEAWNIRALTGSALYCAASLLKVRFPESMGEFPRPEGYVRRIQWGIAEQAILDHLTPRGDWTMARLAPFLIVDHLSNIWPLVQQGILRWSEREVQGDHPVAAGARRVMTGLSHLPTLMSVVARATIDDRPKIL